MKSGNPNLLQSSGLLQASNGTDLPFAFKRLTKVVLLSNDRSCESNSMYFLSVLKTMFIKGLSRLPQIWLFVSLTSLLVLQRSGAAYYTGLSKKMDGIWNRYNLKSTGRIYTFCVLKCSEKFKVLDLP